ncbi:MAG: undecaprenyl-phosphate glucose phosphotransferase [Firmicutes bacterium]|nr:undecaprenyl-phosphate glucose phosphotransferase [Bacillota bacterium]
MLRRYQAFFGRLYALLDAAAVAVALVGAWYLRFHTTILPPDGQLRFHVYLSALIIALPSFVAGAAIFGLYGVTRNSRTRVIAAQLLKADIVMALFVMSLLFFDKEINYSRGLLFFFIVLTWGFALLGRMALRAALRSARKRGFNRKYIVIVGLTNATRRFLQHVREHEELGYHVLGYLTVGDEEVGAAGLPTAAGGGAGGAMRARDRRLRIENAARVADLPCLGSYADLQHVLQRHVIDHLVFTMTSSMAHRLGPLLELADAYGVHTMLLPDFLDVLPTHPRFEDFAGMPIIDTRHTPLDEAVNTSVKRAFDVVFALCVLVIGSPVYGAIALLVKLSSPGPVIFRQERVGKNRRVFQMYKFRTMRQAVDESELDQGWTVPGDPRRTPIGRFLRSTSLDELPQFWNVLRGDMSVIGPRPERPNFVDQFRTDIPRYMIKHRVRPGITGWAQVNGLRGDTSIEERIEYDLSYIEGWSFGWDLRIVGLTVVRGFRNNAY